MGMSNKSADNREKKKNTMWNVIMTTKGNIRGPENDIRGSRDASVKNHLIINKAWATHSFRVVNKGVRLIVAKADID